MYVQATRYGKMCGFGGSTCDLLKRLSTRELHSTVSNLWYQMRNPHFPIYIVQHHSPILHIPTSPFPQTNHPSPNSITTISPPHNPRIPNLPPHLFPPQNTSQKISLYQQPQNAVFQILKFTIWCPKSMPLNVNLALVWGLWHLRM